MKYIQNQIIESRKLLPSTIAYSVVVWMLAGLLTQGWWLQFGLFLSTALIVMLINNVNLLIRIYSRSVSASFMMLSCSGVFLFPSLSGAFIQLCFATSFLTLFKAYQDRSGTGWVFYSFMCISLASIADSFVLCYLPLFWILMFFFVYAGSWRTFFASLFGVITPYWFQACWMLWEYQEKMFDEVISRFSELSFFVSDYTFSLQQLLLLGVLTVFGLIGTIHFLRQYYNDKIRVQQIYYGFIVMGASTIGMIFLLPQHYDMLIRMLIICVSPLIGHFLSLTHTKITNIAFFVITTAVLALTIFNLWTSSSVS